VSQLLEVVIILTLRSILNGKNKRRDMVQRAGEG
jgi:hypothetical protein